MSALGTRPDVPRTADAEANALLGEALRGAGYETERLASELGLREPLRPDTLELPYHLLVLEREPRLGALVRLFQLRLPLDEGEAEAALAPAPLDRLVASGLLERDAAGVRSAVALVPVLGVLLASDWESATRPPERADHVLGAAGPSRLLSTLGVRTRVDAALDLCAGSGLQALLAARHARRVVATDVNPRALRFAELNALLNGVDNVETREGSLFDPVEGETFDAISANPPYVVSPEHEFLFRDSGLPGDSFCEALVRALPSHLREGGIAHLLVAWAHGVDEPWSAPLRRWLDGSGCDALLLRHVSQEPLEYAREQNRMHCADPAAFGEAIERWLDHYVSLGIERIGWGALVLRRRPAAAGRVSAIDAPITPFGPAGAHVLRLLAAQEPADRLDGAGLLVARLALCDDVRVEQSIAFRAGEGVIERALLRLEGGLGLQAEVDPNVPRMLSLLEAGVPVGEVVAEAARELGAAGADADEVAAAALASVRELVRLGFLAPREGETA
jgi:hypothetical protein